MYSEGDNDPPTPGFPEPEYPASVSDCSAEAVPDAPGLGIELNEEVFKEHLRYAGYFEPSSAFDRNAKRLLEGWPHFDVDGKWTTERTSDY